LQINIIKAKGAGRKAQGVEKPVLPINSTLNKILMFKDLCMSAFFLNGFLQSGEAISFFERGYLFKNSTRLCHDLNLEVYAHESMGISSERFKPLILSHFRPMW